MFSDSVYAITKQAAIVHWVQNNADSPVTRKPLTIDQLRDNEAVLSILLFESERPADCIHPCIQRWKDELMSPPPSIVPPYNPETMNSLAIQGIAMNGTTGVRTQATTTRHDMGQRRRGEHRAAMFILLIIVMIASFALIYVPFYLVVFALAFASCMYARRQLHEMHRRETLQG
jgi:hypothetical protein